jgi:ankyrin repeat protein
METSGRAGRSQGKTKEPIMPRLARAWLCLAISLLLVAARFAAAAEDPGDALRRAASAGDLAKVKELLAAGVDVNAANAYGGTALAFAADRGHTAVVELLLERGADVNAKDRFYGFTPLAWAASRGHAEIVRLLLAKGAEGEAEALANAAGQGEIAVVKTILERGKLGPEALSEALGAAAQGERSERAAEVIALLEAAGAKPPAPVAVDPAVLKTYEGTFEGEGYSMKVALKDGKLTMSADGGGILTLAPVDPVTFRVEDVPGIKIVFQVEAGKVRGLILDRGGRMTPLTRKETP